jgi:hypothetical protein
MDREDDDRPGGRSLGPGRGAENPHHDTTTPPVGQAPRRPRRAPTCAPSRGRNGARRPRADPRRRPPGEHHLPDAFRPEVLAGTAISGLCTVARPSVAVLIRGPQVRGRLVVSRSRSGARPCTGLTTTRQPADQCDSLHRGANSAISATPVPSGADSAPPRGMIRHQRNAPPDKRHPRRSTLAARVRPRRASSASTTCRTCHWARISRTASCGACGWCGTWQGQPAGGRVAGCARPRARRAPPRRRPPCQGSGVPHVIRPNGLSASGAARWLSADAPPIRTDPTIHRSAGATPWPGAGPTRSP